VLRAPCKSRRNDNHPIIGTSQLQHMKCAALLHRGYLELEQFVQIARGVQVELTRKYNGVSVVVNFGFVVTL
jgi:hypothetical protein